MGQGHSRGTAGLKSILNALDAEGREGVWKDRVTQEEGTEVERRPEVSVRALSEAPKG